MGIFGYLKSILPIRKNKYRGWYTDSTPVLRNFGSDVYLSDFVNNAIDRIATEISKIEVRSIVERGDRIERQNDDITRLFRYKPNPLQTASDFFSCVEWLRRKNRNAFIYPQYERIVTCSGREYKRFIAFYPLNPSAIYIGVSDGQAWEVKMDFTDGSSFTLPYQDLIHLKWRRGTNTIVGGGDDDGRVDDRDILRTLDALDKTIQGLPKSIESSLQIKGVYTAKSTVDADKLAKARDEFENHIINSKAGIAAVDLAGDFTPVNVSPAQIPDSTLKFLKTVIRERYGISEAIISGDYNGDQHSAFYQTAIEDFIIQFEQAATPCLYTDQEQSEGHRIKAYYSKVNYMSQKDKMDLANFAKETGNMTINQVNEMFGLESFPEGNRRLQSLNYVSVDIVDAYQIKKAEGDKK